MGQKIGLDTPVFIYFLERHPEYLARVRRIMDDLEAGKITGSFSVIGLIEVLTGAKKFRDFQTAANYKRLIVNYPNLTISNINERIIELASDLRAKYNLRTPDAVNLATAIDFGAAKFITNDSSLKKVKEIVVEVL